MVVDTYFGPRQKNRPHVTPNYGPVNISLKFIITDRHIVLHKKYLISGKAGKRSSRSNLLF